MDVLFTLPVAVLVIIPLWRIYERAGLAAPLSLIVFVPYVGLFLAAAILAFADWPAASGTWVLRPGAAPQQPDLFDRNRP
jgi:hypothetical protein